VTLVTHVFEAGDPSLDSGAVFGVKDSPMPLAAADVESCCRQPAGILLSAAEFEAVWAYVFAPHKNRPSHSFMVGQTFKLIAAAHTDAGRRDDRHRTPGGRRCAPPHSRIRVCPNKTGASS